MDSPDLDLTAQLQRVKAALAAWPSEDSEEILERLAPGDFAQLLTELEAGYQGLKTALDQVQD